MTKHALLFAGCINNYYKEYRYGNDLSFMHSVLVNKGYEVKVLYAEGETLYYKNISIETRTCSKVNFIETMLDYSLKLTDEDTLFIMFSNHGVREGINCWGKDIITKSELKEQLGLINAKKIIVLGQCYGGNLINIEVENSIFISANEANGKTIASVDDNYDEFLLHFIAYLNNGYPDGRAINRDENNGSILAAYEYACENDAYTETPYIYNQKIDEIEIIEKIYEIPQIKFNNQADICILI